MYFSIGMTDDQIVASLGRDRMAGLLGSFARHCIADGGECFFLLLAINSWVNLLFIIVFQTLLVFGRWILFCKMRLCLVRVFQPVLPSLPKLHRKIQSRILLRMLSFKSMPFSF